MNQTDYDRLIKIEDKLYEYAQEYGLIFHDIEWDVIPDQKMFEIMAYRIPGNISSWKYGRDYERIRTINENVYDGLPLEVVINSDPSRAYLMKSNTIGQQVLVMAHVIGHVAFFTMNKYFSETRKDMIQLLANAGERFNKYEQNFGIDELEMIIDAGHALQLHSSPFDNISEQERKDRVFKMLKRKKHGVNSSEFRDILYDMGEEDANKMDINLFNQKLLRRIKQRTPIEPAGDLLRYIIDHSNKLEDWQKDVLEILRQEGRYFWPQIQTKYMNEGFATYWHEKLVNRLWKDGHLTNDDMAQFNYSNSLVRAKHPTSMNPYDIGACIWTDIVDRWNKGRHGREWENCEDAKVKENWNTKDGKGYEKMFSVLDSYTDWFFVMDFLTVELVDEMNLYVFVTKESQASIDLVRTKHTADEVRKLIINSFAMSQIPEINITNINYNNSGQLYLKHNHAGMDLQLLFCTKTLEHIFDLWGQPVWLETIVNKQPVLLHIDTDRKLQSDKLPTSSDTAKNAQVKLDLSPVTLSISDLWRLKFPNLRK
jgi:stage V sporulation protein R